jgi:imidazoleglycerol-phosphate dehydratase / histidinol-phosphatase
MKKALFIDRDGTIIREPEDEQIDSFAKLSFLPGAITNLSRIARETDFELVMITNQDGLGTESFSESDFLPVQNFVLQTLFGEGIEFNEILIDRSFAHENKSTRKPGTGLLGKYLSGGYDLANSFVIGDRETDVQLARNIGARSILIGNVDRNGDDTVVVSGWFEIADLLLNRARKIVHRRKTVETDIEVELSLEGSGKTDIRTGIAFFDHMLEQIARHAPADLSISAAGDLAVDEHHTIEDVAITLGEAFSLALADKCGIERYGFCLPMDDCLAQVAVDFGGRSWIVWDAEFKREKIGEMPTEMFFHFFKSFSDNARCNLNIKAEGTIEHHKIEAIFKAFAKAVGIAVRRTGGGLPSTKGVL